MGDRLGGREWASGLDQRQKTSATGWACFYLSSLLTPTFVTFPVSLRLPSWSGNRSLFAESQPLRFDEDPFVS